MIDKIKLFTIHLQCDKINLNLSNLTGQINHLFYLHFSEGLFNLASETAVLPTDKILKQITIIDGSLVKCSNKFNDSKLSVAPNTLTNAGIIFK